MKTTSTTTSKLGSPARHLAMLLTALMVAFGLCRLWAAVTVPFKGSAAGAIVSAVPGPQGVLVGVLAEGHATHLGKFSREELLVLNPSAGTIAGTIVFIAANGDRLSGTVSGQFTSATTLSATYIFTGGTGRFENASGVAEASLVTPDGVNFTVTFEGSVSSIGSGKN